MSSDECDNGESHAGLQEGQSSENVPPDPTGEQRHPAVEAQGAHCIETSSSAGDRGAIIEPYAEHQRDNEKRRVSAASEASHSSEECAVESEVAAHPDAKPMKIEASINLSKRTLRKLKSTHDAIASKLAGIGCAVTLPESWRKPAEVRGSTDEAVREACELLKSGGVAEAPPLTHFVSVRLTQPVVRERYGVFRAQVRALVADEALLPDRLFQRPEKLHMSLAMLWLEDEAAQERARHVLADCCRRLGSGAPLTCRLWGLGTFGSAAYTRVLFTRPEPADQLQGVADLVHGRLCDAGLAKREAAGVTLHATLMNTTFLTRGAAGRRWRKFRGFDSAQILEKLGDFEFGEVELASLEISSLTHKDSDGYYTSIGRGLLHEPVAAQPGSSSEDLVHEKRQSAEALGEEKNDCLADVETEGPCTAVGCESSVESSQLDEDCMASVEPSTPLVSEARGEPGARRADDVEQQTRLGT